MPWLPVAPFKARVKISLKVVLTFLQKSETTFIIICTRQLLQVSGPKLENSLYARLTNQSQFRKVYLVIGTTEN